MVGVKGRSGRISTLEQLARRRAAAMKGVEAKHKIRFLISKESLPDPAREEFRQDCERLGLALPNNLMEALKIRQLLLVEERRKKLTADREAVDGTRIPVSYVDDWADRVLNVVVRELNALRGMFDDCVELTEEKRVFVRKRLIEQIEYIRKKLSEEEIYDRNSGQSDSSGSAGQPVAEAQEEVHIEED